MTHGQPKKTLGQVTFPHVRPGRWTFHVEVAQRWKAEVPVAVQETDTEVRVRVAVGHPGIISGQVVWDDAVRPEFLAVQTDRDGVWIDEHGNKMPGVTERFAKVGPDGRFRFGEVTPGTVRLELLVFDRHEPSILGDAEVIVPASGEAHVELRPIRGGKLTATGKSPQPKCWISLEIAEGGGPFRGMGAAQSDAGGAFTCLANARPGHIRWRVSSRATNERTGGLMDPVVLGEGELDVAVGDDVTIPLPAR
jgi:hypothetical protein